MYFWVNGALDQPSNSAVRYNVLQGAGRTGWNTTRSYMEVPMPTSGKIRYLEMTVDSAPGVAKQWELAIFKNGSSAGSIILSGASQLTVKGYINVSFAKGDLICVGITPTGTPANTVVRYSIGYDCDVYGDQIIFATSGGSVVTASSGRFISMNGDTSGDTTTEFDASLLMPIPGTIKGMVGKQDSAAGTGNSRIYTLVKNSIDTACTFTVAGATDTTGEDLVDTFTVAAGDRVALRIDEGGATTNTRIKVGVLFHPDDPSVFICSGGSPSNITIGPFYNIPTGGFVLFASATTDRYSVIPSRIIFEGMQVALDVAPGVGQNRTIKVENVFNLAGISVVISGTSTTGSSTGSLVSGYSFLGLPVSNTVVNLKVSASATAATTSVIWSFVAKDRLQCKK